MNFCLCVMSCGYQLRGSNQERVALLEARLTEEKDWRKQLEVDLGAAQAALKKDKEVDNIFIQFSKSVLYYVPPKQ